MSKLCPSNFFRRLFQANLMQYRAINKNLTRADEFTAPNERGLAAKICRRSVKNFVILNCENGFDDDDEERREKTVNRHKNTWLASFQQRIVFSRFQLCQM